MPWEAVKTLTNPTDDATTPSTRAQEADGQRQRQRQMQTRTQMRTEARTDPRTASASVRALQLHFLEPHAS
eukprot:5145809-Alexandrium_andersonii.AAC.1